MSKLPDTGDVYEREVASNGTVQVPEKHEGTQVCVFETNTGAVVDYITVESNGMVSTDCAEGLPVTVVVPTTDELPDEESL